jgi:hypothetical protein
VRLRFLLPLVYVVVGVVFLVMLGSDRQGWGPDPFYYTSLPAVLLFQMTGAISPHGASAMAATFAAGIIQYALVGFLLDRFRESRRKQLP